MHKTNKKLSLIGGFEQVANHSNLTGKRGNEQLLEPMRIRQ